MRGRPYGGPWIFCREYWASRCTMERKSRISEATGGCNWLRCNSPTAEVVRSPAMEFYAPDALCQKSVFLVPVILRWIRAAAALLSTSSAAAPTPFISRPATFFVQLKQRDGLIGRDGGSGVSSPTIFLAHYPPLFTAFVFYADPTLSLWFRSGWRCRRQARDLAVCSCGLIALCLAS